MAESLYFIDVGEGQAAIFLHAFALDHSIWLPVANILKSDARIILPDLRGHGRSPISRGKYSMKEMAQDIIFIMDEASIERAIIIGNSMGGYVSLAFARHFPDRLKGLALVASHVYADTPEKRATRLSDIEKLRKATSIEVFSSMPEKLSNHPSIIEFSRNLIIKSNPVGLVGALAGMAEREDMVEFFCSFTKPLIMIAGRDDQFIPIDLCKKMAQLMKIPQLIEIPEAGHLPMLDQPERTAQALRDFFFKIRDA